MGNELESFEVVEEAKGSAQVGVVGGKGVAREGMGLGVEEEEMVLGGEEVDGGIGGGALRGAVEKGSAGDMEEISREGRG